tara:strand:+ start:25708 stop:26286 length:579 start_codon:yes stop_codon:yes gene_type:complete
LEQLLHYIDQKISLSKEAKELVKSISVLKKIKKGDILIRENQFIDKTYFVVDGCLRSYVFDSNGKEHTLQFALQDQWISDYIAIFNNEKSTQVVECIANSTVIEVSISEGIDNIFLRFPEIETLHRKNLQRHIVSLQKRILNQLQLSSLERYHLLQKQNPAIEKYALNYHIASYLGITQQSLSRIRAEIVKN